MSTSLHKAPVTCLALALLAGLPSALLQAGALKTSVGPTRPLVSPTPDPCSDSGSTASLPPFFVDQQVAGPFELATGMCFDSQSRMYVWELTGRVWVIPDGQSAPTLLLDLSSEVESTTAGGLLGFALHPDFDQNGFLYLLYWTAHDYGSSGRLTRYTASNQGAGPVIDPASRTVLIGATPADGFGVCGGPHGACWLEFAEDGTLLVSVGDGANSQVAANEDPCVQAGLFSPEEGLASFRGQLVDSMNGKILRIDPITAEGIPSNPFFDPLDPHAARSRVWVLGLRQPFRFALRPGSGSLDPSAGDPGTLVIGDVGSSLWEELNVASSGGTNFGWPLYEGFLPFGSAWANPTENPFAPNPLLGQVVPGQGQCTQGHFLFQDLLAPDSLLPPSWPNPCDPGQEIPASALPFVHTAPNIAWPHYFDAAKKKTYGPDGVAAGTDLDDPSTPPTGSPFAGNCSVGGTWYTGTDFPPEYRDTYFHADFGAGWIKSLVFGAADELLEVREFAQAASYPVFMTTHPQKGGLYYISSSDWNSSSIRLISYEPWDQPPAAVAAVDPEYGPEPLEARFLGGASSDPEGSPLTFRWDFGDGSPHSVLSDPVRRFPSADITGAGTIIMKLDELVPPTPMGIGNPDREVIRDGIHAVPNVTESLLQFDTLHVEPAPLTGQLLPVQKFVPGFGYEDWIGYAFDRTRSFHGLIFQEGLNFTDLGGWFDLLEVQVRDPGTGAWSEVPGWSVAPAYPGTVAGDGTPEFHNETFEISFPPVAGNGIRLWGAAGGIWGFISVSELRVLAEAPAGTVPEALTARLTVTDGAGNSACDMTTLYLNDGPCSVRIPSPVSGSSFSNSVGGLVPLAAQLHHDVFGPRELDCSWQVLLHHDNHAHPEPPLPTCATQVYLAPHAIDPGDVLYYELRFSVTDPLGLVTGRSAYLYPDNDCNLNGVPDDQDILSGAAMDLNGNGVPDACEADCDKDGIHDIFALALGLDQDEDGDGVPDSCP